MKNNKVVEKFDNVVKELLENGFTGDTLKSVYTNDIIEYIKKLTDNEKNDLILLLLINTIEV